MQYIDSALSNLVLLKKNKGVFAFVNVIELSGTLNAYICIYRYMYIYVYMIISLFLSLSKTLNSYEKKVLQKE